MELARYGVRYLPATTAVICISYSGEVGRTIEAAAQARGFGHRVVALTGRADGRLAAGADRTILLDVPTLGFSPGTSTYVAMVAALLELAAVWGEARDTPGATAARDALRAAPQAAERTIAASLGPSAEAAAALRGHRWVQFVGAGPHESAARFGAAKLFEGPQMLGVATNLEEWAHEEYFVTATRVARRGGRAHRGLVRSRAGDLRRAPVHRRGDNHGDRRRRRGRGEAPPDRVRSS